MEYRNTEEIYDSKTRNSKLFKVEPFMYYLDKELSWAVSDSVEYASACFAAGYPDALGQYIDAQFSQTGMHILGDVMGLNINYARCASRWIHAYKNCMEAEEQSATEEERQNNRRLKEEAAAQVQYYLELSKEHGETEWEYFAAVFLFESGKIEEAKQAFLEIYRNGKNFGEEALSRLGAIDDLEHSDKYVFRKRTLIEAYGDSVTVLVIMYLFALLAFRLFPWLSVIIVAINIFADYKNRQYMKGYKEQTKNPYKDPNIITVDSAFKPTRNFGSEKMLSEELFEYHPMRPVRETCTKTVLHKKKVYDGNGKYLYTQSYTTEEFDPEKMEVLQREYRAELVEWHDKIMEAVREARIENWKKLRARLDQGDENAEILMEAMAFDPEHHHNGVAQIRSTTIQIYQPLCSNMVAFWAPYEVVK